MASSARAAHGRRAPPRIAASGSLSSLSLRDALALGALQGPTELLPVSSSGHLVLVPALLDWSYPSLDPELRKAFEVAVHAGTALALIVALRSEVGETVRELNARRALGVALAFLPAAAAGLSLEDAIERRAGTPRRVALAQIVAGMALAAADRRPDDRPYEAAGALDHLLLGLAQAAALAPGVSRNGATLTGARLRCLDRRAASRLSRHAALPVIAGAAVLKSVRLARRGLSPGLRRAFGVGFASAAFSTFACRGLLACVESARSYGPLGAYRVAFGVGALIRLRGLL